GRLPDVRAWHEPERGFEVLPDVLVGQLVVQGATTAIEIRRIGSVPERHAISRFRISHGRLTHEEPPRIEPQPRVDRGDAVERRPEVAAGAQRAEAGLAEFAADPNDRVDRPILEERIARID